MMTMMTMTMTLMSKRRVEAVVCNYVTMCDATCLRNLSSSAVFGNRPPSHQVAKAGSTCSLSRPCSLSLSLLLVGAHSTHGGPPDRVLGCLV